MLIALPRAVVDADLVAPGAVWRRWGTEPGVLAFLAVAAAIYARAVAAARRRSGGRSPSGGTVTCFVAGWLALAVALVSPLDPLGETLFAAHMAQHLLLILAAAPLIVIGAPPAMWLWALPDRTRIATGRAWSGSPLARRAGSALASPPLALVSHTAALWFWHFPRPYQAALGNPVLHALEHASFLGTALLFWWAVLQPSGRRRLGFGQSIVYVGLTLCQSGALGALLMFSTTAWYPVHAAGEALWALSPLDDQQLAGLIMWIPAGAVYVGAVALLFVRWMRADERAVRAADRLPLGVS